MCARHVSPIEAEIEPYSQPRGGYWLIDTIVEVDAELPAQITPKVRLDRATDAQIATLKNLRHDSLLFGTPVQSGRENKYVITEQTEHSQMSKPFPLNRAQWRYFLLSFEGNGAEVSEVKKLCLIADPPFKSFRVVHTRDAYGQGNEIGWGGDTFATKVTIDVPTEPVPRITQRTIDDIKSSYEEWLVVEKSHPEIIRAINMLNDLRMVPHVSNLYVLGLFAIMELLLTHNPHDKENADSLNHQLSTKIPLINRRMNRHINFESFRGINSESRIWKKLYAYRSAIAHGQRLDFAKTFSFLKGQHSAIDFVEEACRTLLRFALVEPDLFQDLRAV